MMIMQRGVWSVSHAYTHIHTLCESKDSDHFKHVCPYACNDRNQGCDNPVAWGAAIGIAGGCAASRSRSISAMISRKALLCIAPPGGCWPAYLRSMRLRSLTYAIASMADMPRCSTAKAQQMAQERF